MPKQEKIFFMPKLKGFISTIADTILQIIKKTIILILKRVKAIKITHRQVNPKVYKNMKRCSNRTVIGEI